MSNEKHKTDVRSVILGLITSAIWALGQQQLPELTRQILPITPELYWQATVFSVVLSVMFLLVGSQVRNQTTALFSAGFFLALGVLGWFTYGYVTEYMKDWDIDIGVKEFLVSLHYALIVACSVYLIYTILRLIRADPYRYE